MRKIEIITPQNVPIQYQLANVRERAIAFMLDMLILLISLLFLFLLLQTLGSEDSQQLIYLGVLLPIFLFYSFAFELFLNGQTPGKKVVGLRIVKLSGNELSISDYTLRWAFRWIDIWGSFGAIAALKISASYNGQRIGDLLADTSVIKIKPDFNVTLNDLLSIKTADTSNIEFSNIGVFNDNEMLLIKQLIDRQKKYPNLAHNQLIKDSARGVATRLGLDKYPGDARAFLSKVLSEYVAITRS
jgi:uncharacterized RDD family membrane protein YckC